GPVSGPIAIRVRAASMAAMVASALRSRGLVPLEFFACLFHVKLWLWPQDLWIPSGVVQNSFVRGAVRCVQRQSG
ncbi:hypothetical protein, partial [Streptomyces lunaelactis]|uniref:hypothetical protein n=1 Tax=Streptomyces lunaelactis TaxID=1535768 RepID=UPI001C2FF23B